MVIIDGKKFACSTCIKGHRTSSCKHTDRALVEVLKKGRPPTQCEHCRELRKTSKVHAKCDCASRPKKRDPPERITLPRGSAAPTPSSGTGSFPGSPNLVPWSDRSTTSTAACECSSHSSDPSKAATCHCCGPSHTSEPSPAPSENRKRRNAQIEAEGRDACATKIKRDGLVERRTEAGGLTMDSLVQAAMDAAAAPYPVVASSSQPAKRSCCGGGGGDPSPILEPVPDPPAETGSCCGGGRVPIPSFAPPALPSTSLPPASSPVAPTLFAPSTAGTASCFCGPSCPCAGCVVHDPYGLKFRRPGPPASENQLRPILASPSSPQHHAPSHGSAKADEATPCPTLAGPSRGGCLGGLDLPTIEEMLREGIPSSSAPGATSTSAQRGPLRTGCSCCEGDCSCSTCACSGGHHAPPRSTAPVLPALQGEAIGWDVAPPNPTPDSPGMAGMMGAKCAVPSCGMAL